MKLGYARVSTGGQKLGLQRSALRRAGCRQIFKEKRSGVRKRPALRAAMRKLHRGDELLVWKVDRLGRDLLDLLLIQRRLERRGINILSVADGINTSTALGKLHYQIAGAFAEYEHSTLIDRTKAGMKAGLEAGHRAGRKRRMTEKQIARAKSLRAKDVSIESIAAKMKLGKATVWRALSAKKKPH